MVELSGIFLFTAKGRRERKEKRCLFLPQGRGDAEFKIPEKNICIANTLRPCGKNHSRSETSLRLCGKNHREATHRVPVPPW